MLKYVKIPKEDVILKILNVNAEVVIAGLVAIGSFISFIIGRRAVNKNRKSEEISRLNCVIKEKDNEIKQLKQQLDKFTSVDRSTKGNYLILKEKNMPICPICWSKGNKTIPIYESEKGRYKCGACGLDEVYDTELYNQSKAEYVKFYNNVLDLNNYDTYNYND